VKKWLRRIRAAVGEIAAQAAAELIERPGVEDVRRLEPGAPRHHHAPAQPAERVAGMAVARDDDG